MPTIDFKHLTQQIKLWGKELGFQQVGISDTNLREAEQSLKKWLENGYHGEMEYMQRNTHLRAHPEKLHPNTLKVICVRMDYLPADTQMMKILKSSAHAYVSRYAVGRDYHKLIRKRLQKLAAKIQDHIGDFGYRAFVDSAPVMERALAEKANIGWIGKNTLIINKNAGSWFFLGELFTDLPLETDTKASFHCGSCTACLDICPTDAFVGPGELDARKCISYLTIELRTSIPEYLRPLIGNRIFGCDDCQTICPWNKFASYTQEQDFHPRHSLDKAKLIDLFSWSEQQFLKNTEGSAIRRIGYECWLRNIAVGLGNIRIDPNLTKNTSSKEEIISALEEKLNHSSALVREHVEWALQQHQG